MQEYRIRAEYPRDFARYRKLYPKDCHDVRDDEEYEFGYIFTSALDLVTLRQHLEDVDDGHVMRETLNYSSQYTGDRYFDF